MNKVVGMSLNEAKKYLNYNGPVHMKLKPLTPEAIDVWGQKMKVVDYR